MELTKEIIEKAYRQALDQDIRSQDLSSITNFSHALFLEIKKMFEEQTQVSIANDTVNIESPQITPAFLENIELYRQQMAGICTAASGHWKLDDSIHPDYLTPAIKDVARLYQKYDKFFKLYNEEKINNHPVFSDGKKELPLSITKEYINSLCNDPSKIQYTLFPGTFHTVCCITLPNGSTVASGSVCASSEIFDEEKGRIYAFENAKEKIWELEGYSLCEKRFQAGLKK